MACDATEADVAHARVDHLGTSRTRPVAPAVAVGAQERAAFDHLAGDRELWLVGVQAGLPGAAARVVGDTAGVGRVIRVAPQTVPTTTRNARDKSVSLIAVELEPAGKVWPTMPVGTEIRVVLRD